MKGEINRQLYVLRELVRFPMLSDIDMERIVLRRAAFYDQPASIRHCSLRLPRYLCSSHPCSSPTPSKRPSSFGPLTPYLRLDAWGAVCRSDVDTVQRPDIALCHFDPANDGQAFLPYQSPRFAAMESVGQTGAWNQEASRLVHRHAVGSQTYCVSQ